jgi:hypothetical protein
VGQPLADRLSNHATMLKEEGYGESGIPPQDLAGTKVKV